jgi:paraquat-inducible protein A
MAASRVQSLALREGRLDILILLAASAVLLYYGVTLPVIETSAMLFWRDSYSVWWALNNFWSDNEYGLALTISVFSIAFPALKLFLLGFLWVGPLSSQFRKELLHHISFLSRWAMLDVFVVAMMVAVIQAGTIMDARPREGIYCFAGSVVITMVVSVMINRACGKQR